MEAKMICKRGPRRGPVAEIFMSRVVKDSKTNCWNWIAGISTGYGKFDYHAPNGKLEVRTHRVSWWLFVGEIPESLHVLHECDNPRCVNPNHLRLGTHLDNMRDIDDHGRRNPARGERQRSAKLTDAYVIKIRELYHVYRVRVAELARMFGVTHETAKSAAIGKYWTHIPMPNAISGTSQPINVSP